MLLRILYNINNLAWCLLVSSVCQCKLSIVVTLDVLLKSLYTNLADRHYAISILPMSQAIGEETRLLRRILELDVCMWYSRLP